MRATLRLLRIGLGIGLIVHGLGNAVYPLRGIDVAPAGGWMPPLTALYIVSIIGYVGAGLGVLGVWPVRMAIVPMTVMASAFSLVAALQLADADLWPGVVLNIVLLLVVIGWVAKLQPQVAMHRAPLRVIGHTVGLAFFAWVGIATIVWPYTRTWGATERDWAMTLPGDHTPRTPGFEILHVVSIDAPPHAVWQWLVQLGQDRAGFYSYDGLERLVGADVHNVFEIRPEWQSRRPGDRVYAAKDGFLAELFPEPPGWNVLVADADRALVLENWGAFVIEPDGPSRSRLLIRSTISDRRIPVWAAAVNFAAFELPHYIMQRRMMLQIKQLAERNGPALASVSGV